MSANCCVFKFLQRSVHGKYLIRFQSENLRFQIPLSQCGWSLILSCKETLGLKLVALHQT